MYTYIHSQAHVHTYKSIGNTQKRVSWSCHCRWNSAKQLVCGSILLLRCDTGTYMYMYMYCTWLCLLFKLTCTCTSEAWTK